MWSYPSNSTKALPLHFEGLDFSVMGRIDLGCTEAKCLRIESLVAVKGRLPVG